MNELKKPFIFTALKALREIQQATPHAHVGGSIGLFLHGIVLPRDWYNGPLDLDITLKAEPDDYDFMDLDEGKVGSGMDMPHRFIHRESGIRVEMQVDVKSAYVPVVYKGGIYRVKTVEGILYWKRYYADKYEEEKHRLDMNYLEKGWCLNPRIYEPF